jgi:hypothetical protein
MNPDNVLRRDRSLQGVIEGELAASVVIEVVDDSQSGRNQIVRLSATYEEQGRQGQQAIGSQLSTLGRQALVDRLRRHCGNGIGF